LLAVSLTGGNRHDVTELVPLIDKIPPVRGRHGRPRQRADQVFGDRAYDHDKYRRAVRAKGIRPRIARRGQPHGSGLGVVRWVIERTIAWYHGCDAYASAGNAATTSTKPSSASPPASSRTDTSYDFVRNS
jgi:transposase